MAARAPKTWITTRRMRGGWTQVTWRLGRLVVLQHLIPDGQFLAVQHGPVRLDDGRVAYAVCDVGGPRWEIVHLPVDDA